MNTAKKNGRLLFTGVKQNCLLGTMKRQKNLTDGTGGFTCEIFDLTAGFV